MLIIRAYINEDQIDTLAIHNMGETKVKGLWMYEIVEPVGYEDVRIVYRRKDGWKSLVAKVIMEIDRVDKERGRSKSVR